MPLRTARAIGSWLVRAPRALWRSLRPRCGRELFWLLGLYAIMELVLLAVVETKHEFWLLDPIVALFLVKKVLADFALLFAAVQLLLRVPWTAWPATLFVYFSFFMTSVDAGIYYFGNTLFARHHLAFFTWYSLKFFFGPPLLLMTALPVALAALAYRVLRRMQPAARLGSAIKWGALAAALLWFNPNDYIYKFKDADKRLDHYIFRFRNAQLEYCTQNSLVNAFNELVLKDVNQSYQVTRDLAPFDKALQRLQLPLGPRQVPDLQLKPFKRIILFAVESLNLDLIAAHNPALQVEPAPFFLSTPEVKARTFTSYQTTAQPTLPGLTATFFSHPNYDLPKHTGYRNSMVKLLRRQGYNTIFLRSASRYYADENIILKQYGFDRIIAREDFYAHPELRKYIYGWGLEDRLLYQELVRLLEQRRDDRLFITVLGTDTHPPHGQEHYKHLDYPALPKDMERTYGRDPTRFLKSVHHFDYDLQQTLQAMAQKGLLGDDTLVIITADHSCPFNYITQQIPGMPRGSIARIPLIFWTTQQLPQVDLAQPASQVDFAPTLFHLLGLPIPRGWWGQSLYAPRRGPVVAYDQGTLTLVRDGRREAHRLPDLEKRDPELYRLFHTAVADE